MLSDKRKYFAIYHADRMEDGVTLKRGLNHSMNLLLATYFLHFLPNIILRKFSV